MIMILLKKMNPPSIGKIIKRVFFLFAPALLVLSAFLAFQWPLGSGIRSSLQASASDAIQSADSSQPTVLETNFTEEKSGLGISAKSAVSVEFDISGEERILIKKNENKKLPMASLTKLMVALVVLDEYDLNQKISISKLAMEQEGEQGSLKEGQVLSVENLLYIALIESSNRAAFALAEIIGKDNFVFLMNSKARNLGLENTYFSDNTGLDEKSYSTAEDLAKLSKHLFLDYSLFRKIVSQKESYLYLDDGSLHHKLVNTNELLGQDEVVGGKTGYTYVARGCFMVIQKKSQSRYAVHVILGTEDRLLEMHRLMNIASDI